MGPEWKDLGKGFRAERSRDAQRSSQQNPRSLRQYEPGRAWKPAAVLEVCAGNDAGVAQREQLHPIAEVRSQPLLLRFHLTFIHACAEIGTLSADCTLSLPGNSNRGKTGRHRSAGWRNGIAWLPVNRF